MLALLVHVEVDLVGLRRPPEPALVCASHAAPDLLHAPLDQQVRDVATLAAFADGVVVLAPLVLRAPRPADSVEPRLDRPVVVLNAVVARRHELKVVVVGDLIDASPAADGSIARAEIHFDMHHVVLLNVLGAVVLGTVEDEIAWFHLIEL